jgi:hypothetical protein
MHYLSRKLQCFLLVLVAFKLLHAQPRTDASASLSGVIVGSAGASVAVHLEPSVQSAVRYYDGYEAVPKADGSFTFTQIPPGHYRLTVDAGVFVPPANFDSQTANVGDDRTRRKPSNFTITLPPDISSGAITLHPSEHRKRVSIQLTHNLSFCGRVTHDVAPGHEWGSTEGPPNVVPADTSITYYHFNQEFGILDQATSFDTDRDGSFRVTDLPPGTYFVKSGSTWYPSTNTFAEAKPVILDSHPVTACKIDIQELAYNFCWVNGKQQTSAAYIVGKINSDKSLDSNRYQISFLDHNPSGVSVEIFAAHPAMLRPEASTAGESYKANLCAGAYDVVLNEKGRSGKNVWGDAPSQQVIFDAQKVSVEAGQTAQVVLTPHPMASIEGEVRLQQIKREQFCPNCQEVWVSILRDGNGEFQTVPLSPSNDFAFHNVSPGNYQLFVYTTRPDRVVLQSILVDGVSVKDRRFSVPDAKFVSMTVTLSGDLTQAAGHISPDVRHSQHWESEGMRPKARIAGRILGESDATYTVRLLPVGHISNAPDQFNTQTKSDGSFLFESVPPGIYRLRAHDKDYVRFDYGGKDRELLGSPLLITAGARVEGLTLNAPRRSSVCGHVTNEKREPQTDLRILYREARDNGYQQGREVKTDLEGFFRINGLLDGDYFMEAIPVAAGDFPIHLSADGKLYESAPLHVENGKNIGCGGNPPLDLHAPSLDNHYSVSGILTGQLPATVGDRFEVALEDALNTNPYWPRRRTFDLGDDHRFRFDNIPPGRYRVDIYGLYGQKPKPDQGFSSRIYVEPLSHRLASQLVIVSKENLDLTLQASPLPSVTGTVEIPKVPANWKDLKPSDLSLVLVPHRKNGSLLAPLKDTDGRRGEFSISAADPGEYELRIEGAQNHTVRSPLYPESVRLDGKEVNPNYFTLPNDGAVALQVVLGTEMATIEAHVSEDKALGLPALPLNERCSRIGGNYSVILFPSPSSNLDIGYRPEQRSRIFTAWSLGTDCKGIQSGTVQYWDGRIQDVPPGRYYGIAVSNIYQLNPLIFNSPGASSTRSFLSELMGIATPVALSPGEHLDINLSDKTIEAARIAARLGVADEQENLRPPND